MLTEKIKRKLFSCDIYHLTVFVADIGDLISKIDRGNGIKNLSIFHLDQHNMDMALINRLAQKWPEEYYNFGNYTAQKKEIISRVTNGEICSLAVIDNEIVHFQWLGFENNYKINSYARPLDLKRTDAIWYNLYTFPAYRGRDIFYVVSRDILRRILQKNKKRIFSCIGGKNIASYHLHAKLFDVYGNLYYLKFSFWHKYILKKY